jgi:hypothetical protein
VVNVGDKLIGRAVFESGWKWVQQRQADRPDRLLPSAPPRLLHLRRHDGPYGGRDHHGDQCWRRVRDPAGSRRRGHRR